MHASIHLIKQNPLHFLKCLCYTCVRTCIYVLSECVYLLMENLFLQTLQYFEQLNSSPEGWKHCATHFTQSTERYISTCASILFFGCIRLLLVYLGSNVVGCAWLQPYHQCVASYAAQSVLLCKVLTCLIFTYMYFTDMPQIKYVGELVWSKLSIFRHHQFLDSLVQEQSYVSYIIHRCVARRRKHGVLALCHVTEHRAEISDT